MLFYVCHLKKLVRPETFGPTLVYIYMYVYIYVYIREKFSWIVRREAGKASINEINFSSLL
jgi:hypothetical protein